MTDPGWLTTDEPLPHGAYWHRASKEATPTARSVDATTRRWPAIAWRGEWMRIPSPDEIERLLGIENEVVNLLNRKGRQVSPR